MSLDFTNRDHVHLYNELCKAAKQDLDGAKSQIRAYFTSENFDELELYREKIYVAKMRSEQFDSSLSNVWHSLFTPVVITSLTVGITVPLRLSEKNPHVINLPVYIAGAFVVGYAVWLAFVRRQNSKSEKEWTKVQRLLYFLENYNP
ncbi:TPA: hypothetical protein TY888_001678 [Streptococcus suis]|nr:hypothetical protein [Streptococcus suis]HEL2289805.1 hypothetical protein [Streptococcus suis]